MIRLIFIGTLLALVGCAAHKRNDSGSDDSLAPPPFTANQIREATQAGRTYLFRNTTQGNSVHRRMLFREVRDDGCTVESTPYTDGGEPMGEPVVTEYTWSALVSHASYPKSATVITEAPCEVPAGTFDCMVYTVDMGDEQTVAEFAKSLPGAPVRMTTRKNGKPFLEMVLLEHRESFDARVRLLPLWDYSDPAGSRARFQARVEEARTSGNAGYLAELETQIARTYGLEQKFDQAHHLLDEVQERFDDDAPSIARVRYHLERGRTFNSDKKREQAIEQLQRAFSMARQLPDADDLAVDAAHMLGITEPGEEGITWTQKALALAEASDDPAAKRWRGSLYNNLGWAHAEKKSYEKALELFEKCQAFFAHEGERPERERIARWSIAKMHRLLGHTEKALSMQQKILAELDEAGETDGYVHEEMAECLLALERRDEAQPHFAKAYEALSQDAWLKRDEPERLERLKRLSAAP